MVKLKNSLQFFLIFLFLFTIVSRFLIYLPTPRFFSEFLYEFLPFQNFFLFIFNLKPLFPIFFTIFFIGAPLLLLKFPNFIFLREGRDIRIRFWLYLIFSPFFIFGSLFLDVNPFLTAIFLSSIPLFLLMKKIKRFPFFLLLFCLPFSPDIVDLFSIILWIFLLYVFKKKIISFSNRDLVIIIFVLSLIPQGFSSLLPTFINFSNGHKLGDGLAYFFCQSPKNNHIFATISNCPTFKPTDEKDFSLCNQGKIIEFGPNLEKIKEHKFFNSNFYGRMEGLICLPDSLIIGVTNLKMGNNFYTSNGLEYYPDKKNQPKLLREGDKLGGNGAIYDSINQALFTFSEDARKVLRWDLKTRKWNLEVGKYWDVGPLIVGVDGQYFKRKSLFAGEFIGGQNTIEFSSENFGILNYYPSPDGGVLGITVDNKLDRAIISGFWGFSVIDLITKKVIKKIRTGFLPRAAVIDEKNKLIFVASTFDGKIRVFNQITLELIKTIPVGYGVRYLLVEKSGKNLLFGNRVGHFSLPINSI